MLVLSPKATMCRTQDQSEISLIDASQENQSSENMLL
jgi:hypothetical protein